MTAAQRARLVVALGMVNLVLAGVAFGVGATSQPTVIPETEQGSVAVVPIPMTAAPVAPTPAPAAAATPAPETQNPEPMPSPTPTPAATPASEPSNLTTAVVSPPGVAPQTPEASAMPKPTVPVRPKPDSTPASKPAPAAMPAPAAPAATPAATPLATPGAGPQATPQATPDPTPPEVTQPPASVPTPQASPVEGSGHPPCPSEGAPPPGHNKGADPQDRPCKGGKWGEDNGNGDKSKAKDDKGNTDAGDVAGGLLLMPVGLVGSVAVWVRSTDRRRRTPGWLRGRRRAR